MLKEKYEYYKIPGNIKETFYIEQKNNKYYLYNEKDLFEGIPKFVDTNIKILYNYISSKREKNIEKGFELKETPDLLSIDSFCKFLGIQFNIRKIPEEIDIFSTENYTYYFYNIREKNEKGKLIETNHYFVFNEFKEYICRFELSRNEEDENDSYYLGTIFVSENMQRKGHFTNITLTDLPLFFPEDVDGVYIYSILDGGLPFYKKLERLGNFEFIDEHNGFLSFN